MVTFPNAKINLGLQIVGRRSDGYHDLQTVFFPIAWTDVLEIVERPEGPTTLTVTDRGCDCPPEKNLVMKAYRLLDDHVGLPPVDIFLRKIIPDGAGLGGGSADAAFTLKMLNDMFALGYADSELALMASRLGADCAFFIYNRPMLAEGIGDVLTSINLNLSGLWLAVVKPDSHVSTAEAYAGLDLQTLNANPRADLTESLRSRPVEQWSPYVANDFEPSVFKVHPEIEQTKRQLLDGGALYASMSGSGSAVYAFFSEREVAEKAAMSTRWPYKVLLL